MKNKNKNNKEKQNRFYLIKIYTLYEFQRKLCGALPNSIG